MQAGTGIDNHKKNKNTQYEYLFYKKYNAYALSVCIGPQIYT